MLNQTLNTEICIVGAGPAGATLSIFLAKKGIPHLILEASTFPRDKICGDGLDLKVFRVLRHIDPEINAKEVFENQDFVEAWGVRSITPSRKVVDFVQKVKPGQINQPIVRTAKRLAFDHFLVKKMDLKVADFRQETKVTSVARDGDGWKVLAKGPAGELEINAKLIIGCDGDHSVVLRSLGERKIDRRHYAGSVRQYWKGIEGFHEKNLIEVYYPGGYPMSYFYMFPLPHGETNVGYGMVSEVASQGKHNLREIFARIVNEDPAMKDRFKNATPMEEPTGWGVALASRRRKTFGNGYLLLGDAASMVCPTTGEGIGTAMMSAYIAAEFIENARRLNRYDEGVFQNFDREIYRRLNDEIRTYNRMMTYLPFKLYDPIMNLGISSPLYRWIFESGVGGWLRTAYDKPIEVTL